MNKPNKYKVLIVDDEDANIIVLTDILEPEYEVIVAKSGRGAINAAKMYLPDVILLDIIMSDMDGYEVLAALKNDEKIKDIPVIFVSGLKDIDDRKKGISLGASEYISKPFSQKEVMLIVGNQIKIRYKNG